MENTHEIQKFMSGPPVLQVRGNMGEYIVTLVRLITWSSHFTTYYFGLRSCWVPREGTVSFQLHRPSSKTRRKCSISRIQALKVNHYHLNCKENDFTIGHAGFVTYR